MTVAQIESLLLASRDPGRLLEWYTKAFTVEPDADGFIQFGSVGMLIVSSDDIEVTAVEPGRVLLNWEVTDISAVARHLADMGAPTVAPVDYRDEGGAWFHTVSDPDGNLVQIIQLTPAYWTKRRERHEAAGAPRSSLQDASCASRLPAQDLDRARRFYADKLGLEPAETRDGGLHYRCGGTSFAVFQSTGRPSGTHTQLSFYVHDIDLAVAELRQRGLDFDDGGIVDIDGHYPSTGATGERATWFHDSEGNLLGLAQLVYEPINVHRSSLPHSVSSRDEFEQPDDADSPS